MGGASTTGPSSSSRLDERGARLDIPPGARDTEVVWTPPRRLGGVALIGLVIAGCGRLGFDPVGVETTDGGPDATVDGPTTVTCSWASGPPFTEEPDRLIELNSAGYETDPVLSPDGLTLHFGSDRDGTADVYVSQRPTTTARFEGVTLDPISTTTEGENALFITADGLEAYFSRAVATSSTGADLYVMSRASTADAFGPPALLTALNASGNEYDPFVEADGLTLWFTSDARDGSPGGRDVFTATRTDRTSPWGGVASAPINTPTGEGSARLTDDGLVIVYTAGDEELSFRTRAARTEPFGPRQVITAASSARSEFEPFVSGDGCTLMWVSTRDTMTDWDLYALVATPSRRGARP